MIGVFPRRLQYVSGTLSVEIMEMAIIMLGYGSCLFNNIVV